MVPHGDRSKTAIEPYLTDQWFVDTAKIVGPAHGGGARRQHGRDPAGTA
jgi:valyl-tRNA synthetase